MSKADVEKDISIIPDTVDACIELAAKHLPEGYEIVITVENGGYGASLRAPDYTSIYLGGGHDMRSDIIDGIRISNGLYR